MLARLGGAIVPLPLDRPSSAMTAASGEQLRDFVANAELHQFAATLATNARSPGDHIG